MCWKCNTNISLIIFSDIFGSLSCVILKSEVQIIINSAFEILLSRGLAVEEVSVAFRAFQRQSPRGGKCIMKFELKEN
jgi:hypothetical protein